MPMFTPKSPFELAKDGEHYGNKGKTSNFISNLVKDQINFGGVYCYVYRLEGTFEQERDNFNDLYEETETTKEATSLGDILDIQDPVLMENRDRKYNLDVIPVIKGVYQVSQTELELLRFGFSNSETITMEFAQQDVEEGLNRRFVIGDVIELPHLREVGYDGRVANKWYEIQNITWSSGGIDAYYQRHVVGVILQPIKHQQEFLDLFENVKDEYGKTLEEQTSNKESMMNVSEAITTEAKKHVNNVMFDTTIMYFDPNDINAKPNMFVDDGTPPNGLPVDQGIEFPRGVSDGTWFIRTDLVPNKLYQYHSGRWLLKEEDIKREWQPYNWTAKLREFMSDGSEEDENRNWELRGIHSVATKDDQKSKPR